VGVRRRKRTDEMQPKVKPGKSTQQGRDLHWSQGQRQGGTAGNIYIGRRGEANRCASDGRKKSCTKYIKKKPRMTYWGATCSHLGRQEDGQGKRGPADSGGEQKVGNRIRGTSRNVQGALGRRRGRRRRNSSRSAIGKRRTAHGKHRKAVKTRGKRKHNETECTIKPPQGTATRVTPSSTSARPP